MLYDRGSVRVQKSVLLKKIAAIDDLLSPLAGVSPGWRINLRTNDRRCFGQELREASESCPEARNAAGKRTGGRPKQMICIRGQYGRPSFSRGQAIKTALDGEAASAS
jgi:hypothetical protein